MDSNGKEFEFYEMPKFEDKFKEVDLGQYKVSPSEYEEIDHEAVYKEVSRRKEERRQRRQRENKVRARRMKAMIAAIGLVAGYGIHSAMNVIEPYTDAMKEYATITQEMARISEDFSKTEVGYKLDLDVKKTEAGFGGPMVVDLTDPENVAEIDGNLVGAYPTYLAALNDYYSLHSQGGMDYFTALSEQNKILAKFGMGPVESIYTPEQIEALANSSVISLGGK